MCVSVCVCMCVGREEEGGGKEERREVYAYMHVSNTCIHMYVEIIP